MKKKSLFYSKLKISSRRAQKRTPKKWRRKLQKSDRNRKIKRWKSRFKKDDFGARFCAYFQNSQKFNIFRKLKNFKNLPLRFKKATSKKSWRLLKVCSKLKKIGSEFRRENGLRKKLKTTTKMRKLRKSETAWFCEKWK